MPHGSSHRAWPRVAVAAGADETCQGRRVSSSRPFRKSTSRAWRSPRTSTLRTSSRSS